MPYFDKDNLRRLTDSLAAVPAKAAALTEAFLIRQYKSPVAKEYAHHGVCRRLSTLTRCIHQIFVLLPPDRDEVPPRDVLIDATIFIQASVFNAYGVIDNLAFVLVNEKDIRKPDGQPLPKGRVGLTADKKHVRERLSAEMQAYLVGRDPWFTYLENFRDSLGHRIPLYIPPYIVDPNNLPLYGALEARINETLFRSGDLEEHARLKAERDALTRFRPWMKHSFEDPTPPVVFHAQVLADFATLEEISQKILVEIDR